MRYFCFYLGVCLLGAVAAADNLENGNFADALENWSFHYAAEYKDKIKDPRWAPPGDNQPATVVVEVPHASKAHYVRLSQKIALQSGKTYILRYQAKGDVSEGKFRAHYSQKPPDAPWQNLGLAQYHELTDEWQSYEITFVVGKVLADAAPRLSLCYGELKGRCDIRTVSLEGPVDDAGDVPRRGRLVASQTASPVPKVAAAPQPRQWTDSRGRTLTATLVGRDDTIAVLKRNDGSIVRVKIKTLSADDQAHLRTAE